MAESISTPAHLKNQEYIPSKICTKCGFIKPATNLYFYKEKASKDGLRGECSKCNLSAKKSVYKPIPRKKTEINKDFKICLECGFILPITEDFFHKHKKRPDGYSPYCRKCIKQKKTYKDFSKQSKEQSFENWIKAKQNNFENLQESLRYFLGYNNKGFLYWNMPKYSSHTHIIHGSNSGVGYLSMKFNNKTMLVHRAIWIWHNGEIPKGFEIDHINGNRKDNRIENLRIVTHQQNQTNMTKAKGVYYNQKLNKWYAQIITKNGIHKHLGLYETIIDARASYLKAKREVLHDYLQ